MGDTTNQPSKRLKTNHQTSSQAQIEKIPSAREALGKLLKESETALTGCDLFDPKHTTLLAYECEENDNDSVTIVDDKSSRKMLFAKDLVQTPAFLPRQMKLIIDVMITENNLGSATDTQRSVSLLLDHFGLPEKIHASLPRQYIEFVKSQILLTFQSVGSELRSKGYVTLDKEDRKTWHPLARDIVQSMSFSRLPQICPQVIAKCGLKPKSDLIKSQQKAAQKVIDSSIKKLMTEKKVRHDQAGDLLMLALRRSTRPVRILEGMKIKNGHVETLSGEVGRLDSKSKDECEGLRVSRSGVVENKKSIFLGTVEPVPGDALEELWLNQASGVHAQS